MSRYFDNLTRSVLTETHVTSLNKELHNKNVLMYKEGVEKVYKFLFVKGNPYGVAAVTKSYHITSKQVVPCEQTIDIVQFLESTFNSYHLFRKKQFQQKTEKLADSIKGGSVPNFM